MNLRNSIKGFLIILVFAFCGASEAGHPLGACQPSVFPATHATYGKKNTLSLDLKNACIRQDWIKVRYMSGECRFEGSLFPLTTLSLVFADRLSGNSYDSFISSNSHFLFKLRGPPAVA